VERDVMCCASLNVTISVTEYGTGDRSSYPDNSGYMKNNSGNNK